MGGVVQHTSRPADLHAGFKAGYSQTHRRKPEYRFPRRRHCGREGLGDTPAVEAASNAPTISVAPPQPGQ